MNHLLLSICIGLAAALADTIPMILKKLDKLFILSAFFMWLIIGMVNAYFYVSSIPLLNGLFIALMFFLPLSFLIYRLDSSAFLQVCISTVVLGCLVGLLTGLWIK